jgi:hypothetical protein
VGDGETMSSAATFIKQSGHFSSKMFKKRSKKALSHVDWAMSLAVFLLYLAWFFIFVKPLFAPSQNMDVLLDVLDNGLENNIFQDVSRITISVPGTVASQHEPVIIPFEEDWQSNKIAHTADYFEMDEDKMFFLANLSDSRRFGIYYPFQALKLSTQDAVFADEEKVESGTFKAYFDSYLVDKIYFMDEQRLMDFRVTVDDTVLDDEGSFASQTFMAKYKRYGDYLNISSYVFADNSRVYSYMTTNDFRNHSVVVDFAAYNYTNFYIDPVNRGDLSYSILPSCKYYDGDFLDIYGPDSGLLVAFSRNITIKLCTNETNALVTLEFDSYVGEEDGLNIFLHTGTYASVLGYPVSPIVGVTETLKTISMEKVSLLKSKDYGYLKQKFGYPADRDFNITIKSDAVSASYGTVPPIVSDVYARRIEGVLMDADYSRERVLIVLNVW